MRIRARRANDRSWVESLVSEHGGSSRVVSRGILHDALSLPGLVAERDGVPVGLLLYRIERDECEVVVLIAIEPIARRAGCRRLWLITTNDNRSALAFYRAVGWTRVAVHRGAIREARRLKPEIPEFGEDGTPIEDEIEFELSLEGA
jgi:hypothetical protein